MSHLASHSIQCPGVRAQKRTEPAVSFRSCVPSIHIYLTVLRVILCPPKRSVPFCLLTSSQLINPVFNWWTCPISGKTDCVGFIGRSYIGLQCGTCLGIFKDYFDCMWFSPLWVYFRASSYKWDATPLWCGLEIKAVWFYLLFLCALLKQFCPSQTTSDMRVLIFIWC